MQTIDIQRPNTRRAEIVEQGIRRMATHGRRAAIAYMSGAGVSDQVIARVLCEPHLRRQQQDNGMH